MVETIKLPLKLNTNIGNLFSPREFTVVLNVNEWRRFQVFNRFSTKSDMIGIGWNISWFEQLEFVQP